MFGDGGGDGVDGGENFFGGGGVGNFEAVVFIEHDNELEGVDRIEAEAAGTEEREIISDFFRALLEHEVFDEKFFYLGFELVDVVHAVSYSVE